MGKRAQFRRVVKSAGLASLSLAALGTGALWVDSYRVRSPRIMPAEYRHTLVTPCSGPESVDAPRLPAGLEWYYSADEVHRVGRVIYRLTTYEGEMSMSRDVAIPAWTPVPVVRHGALRFQFSRYPWLMNRFEWLEVDRGAGNNRKEYRVAEVSIPIWFAFATFALYPFVSLMRYSWRVAVARNRRLGSCCLNCGYNLTGNESGICSECGTKIREAKPDAKVGT